MVNVKVNSENMIFGNGKQNKRQFGNMNQDGGRAMANQFAQNALKQTNLDSVKRR